MAKDLGRDIRGILKDILLGEKIATNRQNMKRYAQREAEIIRKRTRRGFGVPARGRPRQRLKKLAESTIKQRKRKRLHPSTSPRKSNLTESGQMLDSLYGVSRGKGVGEIAIRPRRRGGRVTNDEVAFHVSGERPFLELSDKEVRDMEQYVAAETEKIIERQLAKYR